MFTSEQKTRATFGSIAFGIAILVASLAAMCLEQARASHFDDPNGAEPMELVQALNTVQHAADQHDPALADQLAYPDDRTLWFVIVHMDDSINDACADLGDDGDYAYNIVLWALNRTAQSTGLPPQYGYETFAHPTCHLAQE